MSTTTTTSARRSPDATAARKARRTAALKVAAVAHAEISALLCAARPNYRLTELRRLRLQRRVATVVTRQYAALDRRMGSTEALVRTARRLYDAAPVAKATPPNEAERLRQQQIAQQIADILDERGGAMDEEEMLDVLAEIAQAAGSATAQQLDVADDFLWSDPAGTFTRMFPDLVDDTRSWITNATRSHATGIARILADAADPARPRPLDEVIREVMERRRSLSRADATRLVRTETARVYGTVAYQTMAENGVDSRRWLTALGSPAATDSPVCKVCLLNAARGWVPVDEGFIDVSGDVIDSPPGHPNCRCDIAANPRKADGSFWLPPVEDEQFTGDEEDLAAAVHPRRARGASPPPPRVPAPPAAPHPIAVASDRARHVADAVRQRMTVRT